MSWRRMAEWMYSVTCYATEEAVRIVNSHVMTITIIYYAIVRYTITIHTPQYSIQDIFTYSHFT
jgi:hypothetical protein